MDLNTTYDWPDYYDWTSNGLDHDLTYYTELAKESGGPVLELGCGTGRCSLAIAREGIQVYGIDQSIDMLQRAEQKAKAMGLDQMVTWMEENMTEFDLPHHKFPLVIIPYRSFLHLTNVHDQIETLKKIRDHLTDDGVLAFNVFVPHLDHLMDIDGKYSYRGTFPIPGSEENVELYDFTEIDSFHQLATITRYMERFDGNGASLERIRTMLQIRYIFPTELCHLLAVCGFRIRGQYGSFYRGAFNHRSEELIVEAVKK